MDPANKEPVVDFVPVNVSSRHDGWTAERQIAFLEALAETACVEEACRRVGMSDSSAYRLRRRPKGALFREAWDAALDYGLHRLEQAALSRALNGVPRPIFRNGEQVGEWRYYDERLTMFLLRNRRPARSASGWTSCSRSSRSNSRTRTTNSTASSTRSNSTPRISKRNDSRARTPTRVEERTWRTSARAQRRRRGASPEQREESEVPGRRVG